MFCAKKFLKQTSIFFFFGSMFKLKKRIGIKRLKRSDSCGKTKATGTSPLNCSSCGGKGKVIGTPCREYAGSGKKTISKNIEINIPAEIDDGQILVVSDQGN